MLCQKNRRFSTVLLLFLIDPVLHSAADHWTGCTLKMIWKDEELVEKQTLSEQGNTLARGGIFCREVC